MTSSIPSKVLVLGTLFLTYSCQSTLQPKDEPSISRASKDPTPYTLNNSSTPTLLNFDELTTLLKTYGQETKASQKADKLFSTPYIDNSHYQKHGLAKPNTYTKIGKALRISTWNIEKSRKVSEVANALTSEKYFISQLKDKTVNNKKRLTEALRQRTALAASDILLCQEMDIGHCRSHYLFAAKHLADKLGMNFVYAPQQLEVDPVYLGQKHITFDNKNLSDDDCHLTHAKRDQYKGVFGVAVMSRYPIKRVQVFPLKSQPYDWYTGEIKKPDFLEKLRRLTSEKVFKSKISREVKVGGRGFTRVDLHVPGVPHETISVINIHLEIKVQPKQRHEQMKEILAYIADIKNPVVMAGEFNNSTHDVSSTSIKRASKRTATNPQNILSAVMHFADVNMVGQIRRSFNLIKNFKNPLALHTPAILPNKRQSLFKLIENYRFNDGGAFDFRGDRDKSANKNPGVLANSNQRNLFKGFTFTFKVPKSRGPLGRDRLDWIFVKSFLTHPKDPEGSYQLAPHYGQTFQAMNKTAKDQYSDHDPISILLPLEEQE